MWYGEFMHVSVFSTKNSTVYLALPKAFLLQLDNWDVLQDTWYRIWVTGSRIEKWGNEDATIWALRRTHIMLFHTCMTFSSMEHKIRYVSPIFVHKMKVTFILLTKKNCRCRFGTTWGREYALFRESSPTINLCVNQVTKWYVTSITIIKPTRKWGSDFWFLAESRQVSWSAHLTEIYLFKAVTALKLHNQWYKSDLVTDLLYFISTHHMHKQHNPTRKWSWI